jgi:hypothetical protein
LLDKQVGHVHAERRTGDLQFCVKIGALLRRDLYRARHEQDADGRFARDLKQLFERRIDSRNRPQCREGLAVRRVNVFMFVEIGKLFPSVDLSIFKALNQFDHWDIENNSPLATLIDDGRFIAPEKQPIPQTVDLLSFAKLRLAQGAELREPKQALVQVRSLARLLLTTENIHLLSSGLSMLDIERRAFRYYVDKGLMEETDWDRYGRRSGNEKCKDCMVHCGFEASSVDYTFGSLRGFIRTAAATMGGIGGGSSEAKALFVPANRPNKKKPAPEALPAAAD